jgi:hypothetical protein
MTQPAPPRIVSLLFCLENEQGHIYSYNRSVGEAARLLGWEHVAAVRAAAHVATVPEAWSLCLGTRESYFRIRPMMKIEKMLKLVRSLLAYFRVQAGQSRPVIYLLEWFDPVHLIAFCLALLLTRRQGDRYVWILHRFEFPKKFITKLYRFLQALIRWRVGRGRLVLFSETDLVAESLKATFGQPVYVLPMPQITSPDEQPRLPAWNSSPERAGKVVCWWPGQPAEAKGLATVGQLIRWAGPEAEHICVVADQRTGFAPVAGGCQLILLPPGMPRADYLGWLYTMDLALLPYEPQSYAMRTSGPFADAISALKPPAVTDGTWMAHELRKYDLDELILDWTSPRVMTDLLRLPANPDMRQKLEKIRDDYARFHSVAGYAETIKKVFDLTRQ